MPSDESTLSVNVIADAASEVVIGVSVTRVAEVELLVDPRFMITSYREYAELWLNITQLSLITR